MFCFLPKSRFILWPILLNEGWFKFYAVSESLGSSSISEVPLTISDPRRILRRIPRDSWSVSRTARISSSSNASLIVSKSDARTRFVSYICVINIFMLNYIYVNFSFVNFHYCEENKLTKKSSCFGVCQIPRSIQIILNSEFRVYIDKTDCKNQDRRFKRSRKLEDSSLKHLKPVCTDEARSVCRNTPAIDILFWKASLPLVSPIQWKIILGQREN